MKLTEFNPAALIALLLCELLIFGTLGCGHHPVAAPKPPFAPAVFEPLRRDLQKSYLTLFRTSPTLEYSASQIDAMRNYLDEARSYCVGEYKGRASQYATEVGGVEDKLKQLGPKVSEKQRNNLHCEIQNDRILETQDKVLADHAIPIAYENKQAKLDLIQQWPGDLKQIKQEIADGAYLKRRWGDVQDIGFRDLGPGQHQDVKTGQEAIKQMKQSGLMPKPLTEKAIVDYVDSVAHKVAAHSDLRLPLHVTVLNSKEINAFALPGGFLYVDRGLLEAADNEAELAGVMGHEIAHVCARHGHQLMVRSEMTSIFYQAAEVAAMIFSGGIASIGEYYALQYGFEGLGLLLNLNLLGVSREFELQADQLGIQYAWNSGYNPQGFVQFFDKMATEEGYVNSLSWFYDHPPFYQRMKDAEREIMFLPKKADLIENTAAFEQMKKALAKFMAAQKKDEKSSHRPSLLTPEVKGCPAPRKIEYKAGEPIETLCSLPGEGAPAGN